MNELQWALIVVGAVAVIAVYFFTRRDRALKNWEPPGASDSPLKPKPPTKEQMEMFQATGSFDEVGVGKPRSVGVVRREPDLAPSARAPAPLAGASPVLIPQKPGKSAEAPARKPEPVAKYEEKFIALLIAEREGTNIFGTKLHAALQGQGLEFGARQIYHRVEQGMVQFSVASLLQPGTLDPAEAASFSTPGLSVFLLLPGPVHPLAAFDGMVVTARRLAEALNGQVFDMQRQPLSDESVARLRAEVETWARSQNLG